LESLKRRVEALETELRRLRQGNQIIEKAFRVIGLHTNYIEFGCYRGGTLLAAYGAAQRVLETALGGDWAHAPKEAASRQNTVLGHWEKFRFFAFDSFMGIPETTGPDRALEVFRKGMYCCSEAAMMRRLEEGGFPMEKLFVVPGFFENTCIPETAERIGLERLGIVHIDSDLYASAKVALEFVTPHLYDPAIVIFDDWFQYFGHPEYGEQLAFREWREAHPEWLVTEFQKEGPWRNAFVLSLRREASFRRRGIEPME
jgi:hypothetical protein